MSSSEPYTAPGRQVPILSQVFLLAAFMLLGFSLFSLIGVGICRIFNIPILTGGLPTDGSAPGSMTGMEILQVFSTLGLFVVPALLFPRIALKVSPPDWLGLRKQASLPFYVLGIIAFLAAQPIVEWVYALNSQITFPASFGEIEKYLRQSEDTATRVTKGFLAGADVNTLLKNLLIVAFWAALCEELFFRGLLLTLIHKWSGRKHVAVWLSAIAFSAIHGQFFGFFPRMLLGALFGYFFIWTGSLILPILIHALNNGIQVVMAWMDARAGREVHLGPSMEINWVTLSLSALLCLLVLNQFYRISHRVRLPRGLGFSGIFAAAEKTPAIEWTPIFTTTSAVQAEIVAGKLRSVEFRAVVVNKQSRPYGSLGTVEVHVPVEEAEQARLFLESAGEGEEE